LAFDADGRLWVANLKSGSLTAVDPGAGKATAEHDVGRGLSDVAALGDRRLLVVDHAAGAVLIVAADDGSARVLERREVGLEPWSAAVSPAGGACVVAVSGDRKLTQLKLEKGLTPGWSLDLPFPPRNLAWLRGGARLVAADAFRGRLAVVDPAAGRLVRVIDLPAHNIRGLAVSPDGESLLVAHQVLRRLARTSFEDVHWGSLVSNQLRVLSVEAILSNGDAQLGARVIELGGPGAAAGDPSALVYDRSAGLAVALGGVDELAIASAPGASLRRAGVGRRPAAAVASPNGTAWYVANQLDDTISVLDRPTGLTRREIPLGPMPAPDAVARGERLFYDAKLSHDGWMSCHSCHTDGATNGGLADTLADGSYGAPKLVPSLFGVGSTGPWTWTGGVSRLEEQVRTSVVSTMQGKPLSNAAAADLTAFLASLAPPRPRTSHPSAGDADRGARLFRERKCDECHAPPDYTKPARFDVGLTDAAGNRKFNPPSLRGVDRRGPFLHDGRVESLVDVFRKAGHPSGTTYVQEEADDLAAYLRTL
jgi:cytochrome c peroxidase